MKYAPLVIFCYNRAKHLEKTLHAINENFLSSTTKLYIFCDGPKNDKDYDKVKQVYDVIENFLHCNKFESVNVSKKESNIGLANSIINGVTEVINIYGKIIVLEDDLITAPNFLDFMNSCLDFYKQDKTVWSIGGTSYKNKELLNYTKDVYASYRVQSCGWATWEDRWKKNDWEIKDYYDFKNNKYMQREFKRGGSDLVEMLDAQMSGKIDSWAIRWCYNQYKNNMITILPKSSRIYNIGMDGSGTNCVSDEFKTEIEDETWEYKLEHVKINEKIMKEFRKYFKRPFLQKVLDNIYLWMKKYEKNRIL